MVKTRSCAQKEKNGTEQQEDTQLHTHSNDDSVELMARLAFNKMETKLIEKKKREEEEENNKSLPEVLYLPSKQDTRDENKVSSLDAGLVDGLLIDTLPTEAERRQKELMMKTVLTEDFERKESAPPMFVSRFKLQKMKKAEREKSAGSGWFHMPAPEMNEELKNDLKIIQMRSTLDRTHYYKNTDWKQLPKYFQVGRVIEGAGEFYSARVPKKLRKRTIVEELLNDQKFRKYQKDKYALLQKKKQFMMSKRRKGGKTKYSISKKIISK